MIGGRDGRDKGGSDDEGRKGGGVVEMMKEEGASVINEERMKVVTKGKGLMMVYMRKGW